MNAPASLLKDAKRLEASGDYPGAAEKVREALELKPEDKDLLSRLAALEEKAGAVKLQEQARSGLARAERLVAGERYVEAEAVLQRSRAAHFFKEEAVRLLQKIDQSRYAKTGAALEMSRKASEKGELDEAIFYVESAMTLGPVKEPLRDKFTDFSRRLGMQLFSRGELSSARLVWSMALESDPGNEVLGQYLKEVDQRLENLKRIQQQEKESK